MEDQGKVVHKVDESRPSRSRSRNSRTREIDLEKHRDRVGALYEEHNSALIRFLSVRLHSEQEAREIAQEAYVKLLGLDEPESVNHFRAYLFRVAANLATDRLKQRTRRAALRSHALAGTEQASPSPERALSAQQELAIVQEAVKELPVKCRTAFLLHKIHQVPLAQTALRMGLTDRMVRLYVARALSHCAARLEASKPGSDSTGTNKTERS